MKLLKPIAVAWFAIVLLPSCFVGQRYQRNPGMALEKHFREAKADSATIASTKWQAFFKDEMLNNYIAQAVDSNFDIRRALKNMELSSAYLRQAKSNYYPSLSVGPDVSFQSMSTNTFFGGLSQSRRNILQYGLSADVSWEADLWGKLRSTERAQQAEFLRSTAMMHLAKANTVSEVARNYFRLLALDEQAKIISKTIATRKKTLETTEALKTAGSLTEAAVQQAEAQWLNAQALLINVQRDIKLTENALSVLLGMAPQEMKRGQLDDQKFDLPLEVGIPAFLLNNRPDLRAAEYELINAFEWTNVARANFYPNLNITASTGFQSVDFEKLFNPQSLFINAVASLTQPLWNRRQIRSQYEARKALQEAAYLSYKKSFIDATREVSDALFQFEAQGQLAEIKLKEFEAYQKATSYASELVNYGMANYLEVLRAQENELNAQLSMVIAVQQRLEAIVMLYKALGGGW